MYSQTVPDIAETSRNPETKYFHTPNGLRLQDPKILFHTFCIIRSCSCIWYLKIIVCSLYLVCKKDLELQRYREFGKSCIKEPLAWTCPISWPKYTTTLLLLQESNIVPTIYYWGLNAANWEKETDWHIIKKYNFVGCPTLHQAWLTEFLSWVPIILFGCFPWEY